MRRPAPKYHRTMTATDIGADGADYGEIAEALGVSRQRVQQIERAALLKARRWIEENLPGVDLTDLLPGLEHGRPDEAQGS